MSIERIEVRQKKKSFREAQSAMKWKVIQMEIKVSKKKIKVLFGHQKSTKILVDIRALMSLRYTFCMRVIFGDCLAITKGFTAYFVNRLKAMVMVSMVMNFMDIEFV